MKKTLNVIKTAIDVFLIVLVAFLAIITILLVAFKIGGNGQMTVGGVGFGRIATGSMETALPTGSFVLIREVDTEEIVVGDIIMFFSDDPTVPQGYPVTHRVVEVISDDPTQRHFITKGDANPSVDDYPALEQNVIGRVIGSSVFIGKLIGFSQKPFVYPILIFLLLIDLIFNAVIVYKQAKELKRSENI